MGKDKYQFLKVLGRGASAVVYKARHKETNQIVAIKRVPLKFPIKPHEVAILRSIRHPGIIEFHESFEDASYQYMVLEICEKGDLQYYIDKIDKPFPQDIAKGIAYFINKALVQLNRNKICHRDLKPANILVSGDFALKVADFGFAKIEVEAQDLMQSNLGTPLFMSPQLLLEAQNYSIRVDIWGLGLILFILLFGKHPFYNQGENKEDLKRNVQTDLDINTLNISAQAKDLLAHCFCQDSSRYSAEEVANSKYLADVAKNEEHYQKLIAEFLKQYSPTASHDVNKEIAYVVSEALSIYIKDELKAINLVMLSQPQFSCAAVLYNILLDSFREITHLQMSINNLPEPYLVPIPKLLPSSESPQLRPLEKKIKEEKACLELVQMWTQKRPELKQAFPDICKIIDRVIRAPKELKMKLETDEKTEQVKVQEIVGYLAKKDKFEGVETKIKAELVYVSSRQSLLAQRLSTIRTLLMGPSS